MLSRRALIGKLAAGAAGATLVGIGSVGRAAARSGASPKDAAPGGAELEPGRTAAAANLPTTAVIDADAPETGSAPRWELLRPLTVGAVVAHGWRVGELSGVVDGSCVLTLRNERGRAHRVHLCRNDGRPQGLVHTARFDLVVMNGGQGDLPTEEGLAQAVAAVAHVLAANEGPAPVETAWLPHAERVRLFAGPVDRRLR